MCILKILFSSFRKYYGLLDSELPLARYHPLKIQSFVIYLLTQQFFYISKISTHFLKELKMIFLVHINVLPKMCLIFCCRQQKIQKMNHFWHLMTIIPGVNAITRKKTPFFSSSLRALSVGIFHFLHFKTFKI